jgi:hypothetical protein
MGSRKPLAPPGAPFAKWKRGFKVIRTFDEAEADRRGYRIAARAVDAFRSRHRIGLPQHTAPTERRGVSILNQIQNVAIGSCIS